MCKNTVISINIRLEIPGSVEVTMEQLEERVGGSVVAEDNEPDPDPPKDVEVIQNPETPEPEAKGFPPGASLSMDGRQMTAEETAEFFRRELEGNEIPKTKDGTPVEEAVQSAVDEGAKQTDALNAARAEFLDLTGRKFADVHTRDAFIRKNLFEIPPQEWTMDHYELAIGRLTNLPDYEETAEQQEDSLEGQVAKLLDGYEGNIRSEFISLLIAKIPDTDAHDGWMTENVKPPTAGWGRLDYARGIVLLSSLPGTQDAENGQNGTDDNLSPILTKATLEAVKKLVNRSDKYPQLRSKAFRDRAAKIIGHKYREFKKIREEEGKLVLAALQEESVNGIEEPRDDDADPNAAKELVPEDVLAGEQKALIEHYVEMMPDRFRMGTEVVRNFITAAIKKAEPSFRYSSLMKLTQTQGAIVIQAQKDFIRDEADKFNAANGGGK